MSTLKETWKKVGEDLDVLGKDLEKSIVKTVKTGVKTVTDWANREDEAAEPEKADVTVEPERKQD